MCLIVFVSLFLLLMLSLLFRCCWFRLLVLFLFACYSCWCVCVCVYRGGGGGRRHDSRDLFLRRLCVWFMLLVRNGLVCGVGAGRGW